MTYCHFPVRFYAACTFLLCFFITTLPVSASSTLQPMAETFDIAAFERHKQSKNGIDSVEFTLDNGDIVEWIDENNIYEQKIKTKQVYQKIRSYSKQTGRLLSQKNVFQHLGIGKASYYDEEGNIVRQFQGLPEDQLNLLIETAKARFKVDLWDTRSSHLSVGNCQGLRIIRLYHLNGRLFNENNDEPFREYVVIRFTDLAVLATGRREITSLGGGNWDKLNVIDNYMYEGLPLLSEGPLSEWRQADFDMIKTCEDSVGAL
jgi:hypothetical protein